MAEKLPELLVSVKVDAVPELEVEVSDSGVTGVEPDTKFATTLLGPFIIMFVDDMVALESPE